MRILLVGGGSGGHVTPLKAITGELLQADSASHIDVITNRGFITETRQVFADYSNVRIHAIFAGKYRRYQSKSLLWHVLHLPTLLYNIRDIAYIMLGIMQSLYLMLQLRPDVVFCKGGFVCIPVGIAARLFGRRLVIHDSDTRPGLTNRILSRWASIIATGMPEEFYPYDKQKIRYTGMPVDPAYRPQSSQQKQKFKQQLGFSKSQPVLLVTGGGNGAESLNFKISEGVGELLAAGWGILHVAGRGKAQKLGKIRGTYPKRQQNNWHIEEFVDMVPRILAADVVVARTSASTIQECANSQKVVIGVPSPHLDDQIKNAQYFASRSALESLDETQLTGVELADRVQKIFSDTSYAETLSANLHTHFAKPNAARELAALITGSA